MLDAPKLALGRALGRARQAAGLLEAASVLPLFRSSELGPALADAAYETSGLAITFAAGVETDIPVKKKRDSLERVAWCLFRVLKLDDVVSTAPADRSSCGLGP